MQPRLTIVWLLIAAGAAVPLAAQEPVQQQPEQSTPAPAEPPPADAATPAEQDADPPQSRSPVRRQDDEDVFVPSEEISLDKSVAFPSDI